MVIDTTVLVRAIPSRGPLRRNLEAFDERRFCLVLSNEILLEYEEILKKLGGPNAWTAVRDLLDAHGGDVIDVEPSFRWGAILSDPDDNKFVDAAVAGDSEWIVTDDAHFHILDVDTRLVVRPLPPERFIARYC